MASQIKLNDTVLKELIKQIGQAETHRYTIADGVLYGQYVEFGTEKMTAQPFLRPAFDRVTRDLPKAVRAAIEAGARVN